MKRWISSMVALVMVATVGVIVAPAADAATVATQRIRCNTLANGATVTVPTALAVADDLTVNYQYCNGYTLSSTVLTGGPVAIATNGSTSSAFTNLTTATAGGVLITISKAGFSATIVNTAGSTPVDKVTICHRTRALTNPYVLITVSVNSVVGTADNVNGHHDHNTTRTNKVNPTSNGITPGSGPFSGAGSYVANKKWWGDIIPPFAYEDADGVARTFTGLNWAPQWQSPTSVYKSGSGQYWITDATFAAAINTYTSSPATYDTAVAQCMNTATGAASTAAAAIAPDPASATPWLDYYSKMRNSGETGAEAFDGISELEAYDPTSGNAIPVFPSDAGAYSSAYTSAGGPFDTTDAASGVGETSATLNGTFNTPPTGRTWASYKFFYYTGSADASATSSAAKTSTGAVTGVALTGLTCGTTYYFQLEGTLDNGSLYYGDWKSFTTSACPSGGGGSSSAPASTTPAATPAPTAVDDAYTTPFNTPLTVAAPGVLTNDTGSGLSVGSYGQPANGTVTMSPDGSFTYTPNPGFTGVDTFPYDISDSSGRTASANVSITVPAPPAGTPTTSDDRFVGAYEAPLLGTVTTNDTFPLGSTYSVRREPRNGTVRMNRDGTFVYQPNPGFSGVDTFTYLACAPAPNASQCSVSTVTITIAPPATTAGPITNPDLVTLPAGSTKSAVFTPIGLGTPSAGSSFNGTIQIAPVGGSQWDSSIAIPGQGTWTIVGRQARFAPEPGFVGTSTIQYRIQDGTGRWATSTLTAIRPAVPSDEPLAPPYVDSVPTGSVKPVPFTPVLGAVPVRGSKFRAGSLKVTSQRTSNWSDSVTVPGKGEFRVVGDRVVFKPRSGFRGTAQARYRMQDETGSWAWNTITVTSPPLRGMAPVLLPSTRMLDAAKPKPVSIVVPRVGRASLGSTLVPRSVEIGRLAGRPWYNRMKIPGKGQFRVKRGRVTFDPAPRFTGTVSVKVRISQRDGQLATSTITVVGARPSGLGAVVAGR